MSIQFGNERSLSAQTIHEVVFRVCKYILLIFFDKEFLNLVINFVKLICANNAVVNLTWMDPGRLRRDLPWK